MVHTYSELKGINFVLTATDKAVDKSVPIHLVKKFESLHKPIATICHGQLILAAAVILKNRTQHSCDTGGNSSRSELLLIRPDSRAETK